MGYLIISLDFELHWGRYDKYPIQGVGDYYKNTREAIPRILDLFAKYNIHATWATVGSLMAENVEEWRAYQPEILPNYINPAYSAYYWFANESNHPKEALFAPDLVQKIIQAEHQELGSHTYSHFYTGEKGANQQAFKADLEAAKKIAKDKFATELKSLVFPRNQYNPSSLETASKLGIKVFRTNPPDWFWSSPEKANLLKKVFRTGDTLIPLGSKTYYDLDIKFKRDFLQLPASRLLRPYKANSIFNTLRVERIKNEMAEAAKEKMAYHLWWHPHNFGINPKENLEVLEDILQYFSNLHQSTGMESLSMWEAYEKNKQPQSG
ncbi:polysaccharide deacetylase [Indibacter alkaliphilus LW1]|uniref:Polysaccharide deacetylase n=1 Tax=Indibacter alkaliphilus (strain CCUG 57479 / KCTC 22604 / LW1) TaxID=1189612 RepID=S2E2S4_INDAL|nr:polysaccharide deacetylase [Indibacter alkaliphilus LW1]